MPSPPRALSPLVFSCAILAAAGCGAAHQAAVEIGPPSAEASPGDDGARADRPRAQGPGCTWTGSLVTPRGESLPLCFAVDGACFAEATSPFIGRASVTLPDGKPAETGAKVELTDSGVRISAWTAGDGTVLFADYPLLFGPAAVVFGGPALTVERVHGGWVDLSFRGDSTVKLATGALRGRAACAGVGLALDAWNPAEVLSVAGVARTNPTDWLLPVDQPVSVSATPGGTPVLDIVAPSEDLARVEGIEQRGPWVRVLWWQPDGGVVFGWVDGPALAPAPPRPEPLGSSAASPGVGTLVQPHPGTTCPVDVPLFASVAGTTAEVGTLLANTRFDATRVTVGEYTQVRIRAHHFDPMPDSVWLVRTLDLQPCTAE